MRSTSTNSLLSKSSSSETLTLAEQTKKLKNLGDLKEHYTNTKTKEAKKIFLNELNELIISSANESNEVLNKKEIKQKSFSKKNNENHYFKKKKINTAIEIKLDESVSKTNNKKIITFLNRLSNITRKGSSEKKQTERISRNKTVIKPNQNTEMVRETPSKNSKNVSFRASSLATNKDSNCINQHDSQQVYYECQQRFYRSLSPNKHTYESYASIIGQEPALKKSPEINKNVYFAQAIGQSNHYINNKKPSFKAVCNQNKNHNVVVDSQSTTAERILEIHTSPVRKEPSK